MNGNIEVLATVRVTRTDDGIWGAVIDYGNGSAPEAIEGYATIGALLDKTARMVADSFPAQRRRP